MYRAGSSKLRKAHLSSVQGQAGLLRISLAGQTLEVASEQIVRGPRLPIDTPFNRATAAPPDARPGIRLPTRCVRSGSWRTRPLLTEVVWGNPRDVAIPILGLTTLGGRPVHDPKRPLQDLRLPMHWDLSEPLDAGVLVRRVVHRSFTFRRSPIPALGLACGPGPP